MHFNGHRPKLFRSSLAPQRLTPLICFVLFALLSVACAPTETETDSLSGNTAVADATVELPEQTYLERALAGEFSGTTVTMTGVVVEDPEDVVAEGLGVADWEDLLEQRVISSKQFMIRETVD